eukprot:5029455-Amphidinium_carterae.1
MLLGFHGVGGARKLQRVSCKANKHGLKMMASNGPNTMAISDQKCLHNVLHSAKRLHNDQPSRRRPGYGRPAPLDARCFVS